MCEAAEAALINMTNQVSPSILLPKLEASLKHKDPRVKAKSCMCFDRSVPHLVSLFLFNLTMCCVSSLKAGQTVRKGKLVIYPFQYRTGLVQSSVPGFLWDCIFTACRKLLLASKLISNWLYQEFLFICNVILLLCASLF